MYPIALLFKQQLVKIMKQDPYSIAIDRFSNNVVKMNPLTIRIFGNDKKLSICIF